MATQFCITDFKNAVKGIMTASEADEILNAVEQEAQARINKGLQKKAEAYNTSAEEILKERGAKAKQQTLENYINLERFVKAKDQIKGSSDNAAKGTLAYMGGIQSNKFQTRNSLAADIAAQTNRYLNQAEMLLARDDLLHVFNDKTNSLKLAQELDTRGSSKDPQLKKVADIIAKVQKMAVNKLVDLGVDRKLASNYIARLVHRRDLITSPTGHFLKDIALKARLMIRNKGNFAKVRDLLQERAFTRWKQFITPLLDWDRTLQATPDVDRDAFLRTIYDSISTGIHKLPYRDDGDKMINLAIRLRREKDLKEERTLIFKRSGEAWHTYNNKYGYGSTHDSIISHFEHNGRTIGVTLKLGTKPRAFAERLLNWARQESRGQRGTKFNLMWAKSIVDTALGDLDTPHTGLLGKIFKATRMMTFLNSLGGIVISSIPDLVTRASKLRDFGIPGGKVYAQSLRRFVSLRRNDPKALRELGLQLGIYSDGTVGGALAKFGDNNMTPDFYTKAMNVYSKMNGISKWDQSGREVVGFNIANALAEHIDQDYKTLGKAEHQSLFVSGIDEKTWNLLRNNKEHLFDLEGRKYLTPEIVDNLSDQSLLEFIGKERLTAQNKLRVKAAREEVKDRLLSFFQDQIAFGQIRADVSDRAFLKWGVRSDSLPGAIWNSLTIFKSFMLASGRRVLGRFLYGGGADNLYEALIGGKADIRGLLHYMTESMVIGYLSFASRFLLRGETPPNLSDPKTWAESFDQSGAGALYAGLLVDQYRSNAGFIDNFEGPQLRRINDVADFLLHDVFEQKKRTKAFLRILKEDTPGISLVYLKPIVDHLFLNQLMESADPGYLSRQVSRAQKENQHYFISPYHSLF